MSYVNGLDHVKRRPKITRLTGAEAIKKLNTIAEEADRLIANALGQAKHFEQIANEVADENRNLLRECERLTAENRDLRAQLARATSDLERARKRAKAARVQPE